MDAASGDQELTAGNSINPDGILEESRSFANGAALEPKVRKPYTISKQRERWTEEEHQRFLDALQLHGRSWRKIEEHVGTKTTVQIRSHAQKFFSKVAREANCEFEIPPPRPKRKPDHPYPRKLDHPHRKRTQIQGQLKDSSSLQSANAFEEDNISPTSVITLHQSENEAASNELENQNQSIVSRKEDGNFLSLGSLNYDGKKTENKSTTIQESNLKFEDSKKTVETLRLFGKTVIMSDSDKQALEDDHIASDTVNRNPQGSSGLDAGNPSQSIQNAYPSDLDPANPSQSIQNACQVGVLPTIQCLSPYEGQARMILVPQWAFCWKLPFPTGHESRFVLSHCFLNSVHLRFTAVISVLRIKHTPSLRCRGRVSAGTLVPYTRLSCTFSITEGLKCSSYSEGTAQLSVRNECSSADSNPAPERGSVFDPQYRDHSSETKVNTNLLSCPIKRDKWKRVQRLQKRIWDNRSRENIL